ncbi:MAG: DUF333 domain-containing protein [Gemmobacter sp.]|jgi:putative hemolysin|nr:DUF333 domain-containing protein [Gemmobacter sp.]
MPLRPALLLLAAALLTGCAESHPAPSQPQSRWTGMANPASRYCADRGGRLEIRTEQAGQAGYCHLPDGSVIEEWQLYRGQNSL